MRHQPPNCDATGWVSNVDMRFRCCSSHSIYVLHVDWVFINSQSLGQRWQEDTQKRSGDPNPQYFSKGTAVQMGGVLPYKLEAYCSTNGRLTAGFPFLRSLEARKVRRYKWGAYCRTNWRCTAVLFRQVVGVGVSETLPRYAWTRVQKDHWILDAEVLIFVPKSRPTMFQASKFWWGGPSGYSRAFQKEVQDSLASQDLFRISLQESALELNVLRFSLDPPGKLTRRYGGSVLNGERLSGHLPCDSPWICIWILSGGWGACARAWAREDKEGWGPDLQKCTLIFSSSRVKLGTHKGPQLQGTIVSNSLRALLALRQLFQLLARHYPSWMKAYP